VNKRLLVFGLVAVLTQVFSTGCCLVSRWRANHPCGIHSHYHPFLHPIKNRRAAIAESQGAGPVNYGGPASYGGPVSYGGPAVSPPCHGCASGGAPALPGMPVAYGGVPGEYVVPPTAMTPSIGSPLPLAPGPKVVPSHELPNPMPVPKAGTGGY
jgi:hypothetical protein